MSDLALVLDDSGRIDLAITAGDLVRETTLNTCVLVCLGTDARAGPDDAIPDGTTDRRGWWGDALGQQVHGSLLWLLSREKHTAAVAQRLEDYARQALAWMVPAGLAARIDVQATLAPGQGAVLAVTLYQRDGSAAHYEYNDLWS
ncbi:phage GP46 family protein [Jeongeupia chitinilytica]|uniref:Mu-like prophage protein gp46 n=1 Tax=Jeongeupia chitinilytica TaxID=1041641 RepID=A0ABQ3GZV9_9NEIS|nr:phage GP46 family protein [Jeongeupia chitinilytica]GHD60426.1 hypothetical protein GCM10007350_13440 [Jeongeupia chitinilytica]